MTIRARCLLIALMALPCMGLGAGLVLAAYLLLWVSWPSLFIIGCSVFLVGFGYYWFARWSVKHTIQAHDLRTQRKEGDK